MRSCCEWRLHYMPGTASGRDRRAAASLGQAARLGIMRVILVDSKGFFKSVPRPLRFEFVELIGGSLGVVSREALRIRKTTPESCQQIRLSATTTWERTRQASLYAISDLASIRSKIRKLSGGISRRA